MAYRKFRRVSYRRRFRRRARRGFRRRVRRVAMTIAEKKYYQYWFDAAPFSGTIGGNFPKFTAMPSDKPSGTPYTAQEFSFASLLANLQQGFTDGTRIGNRVFVDYIHIVINAIFAPAAGADGTVNGCICRYSVQKVRGTSGSTAINPMTAGLFHSVVGLKNPAYMRTRKTLLDRQIRMAYTSGSGTGVTNQGGTGTPLIQHYIPVKRVVQFSGINTPDGDMSLTQYMMDNDIQFGACSQMANSCRLIVGVRVCFRDA